MPNRSVRVRFAPSPTGSLHLGGARTALYNYLFAKHYQGSFILRIEDTDVQRNTESALRTQLADLNWLGLNWDEGPDPVTLTEQGQFGPYQQSMRATIYAKHVEKLLQRGLAYYCFLSEAQIKQQREQAQLAGKTFRVQTPDRDLPLETAQRRLAQGEAASIRFKTPLQRKTYTLDDIVRGEINLPSDMVGDFIILRSNNRPVYNFSCVVDDALMKITHVFRGEEHLSNTLRQLMLYEAFNYPPPKFGHLSIILGENRKKLSKRDAAVSCSDFKQQGYLPQALLNTIALLGWTDKQGREVFTLPELVTAFNEADLNSSAAIFDPQKLNWLNAQHIRQMPKDKLWQILTPKLAHADIKLPQDKQWQQDCLQLFSTEVATLNELVGKLRLLDDTYFELSECAREILGWESTGPVLALWCQLVSHYPEPYLSEPAFKTILTTLKQRQAVKGKQLFMPLRLAMIGQPEGAELKLLAPLLSKQQLLHRGQICLANLTTR